MRPHPPRDPSLPLRRSLPATLAAATLAVAALAAAPRAALAEEAPAVRVETVALSPRLTRPGVLCGHPELDRDPFGVTAAHASAPRAPCGELDTGAPLRPGGRRERWLHRGLFYGGYTTFLLGYAPGYYTAVGCLFGQCSGLGWLAVPLAGPFVAMTHPQTTAGYAFLTLSAAAQLTGLAMMVAAYATSRPVVVYDQEIPRPAQRLSVAPLALADGAGAVLTLTSR